MKFSFLNRKNLSLIFLLLLTAAIASSCATNRKCNGKRGVRTNMGLM